MLCNKFLVGISIFIITLPLQLVVADTKTADIEIANPKSGISYNLIEEHGFDNEGIVINNSIDFSVDNNVGANKNLDVTAKTILLKIASDEHTQLKGVIKVVGEKAKLIIVNPNGITCDGCSFVNVSEVEIRTDKIDSIVNDQINWGKNLNSDIYIGKNGVAIQDGSLILNSRKIVIDGQIVVGGLLKISAYLDQESANYSIDVGTYASINAGEIYLSSVGKNGGIKVSSTAIISKNDVFIETKGNIGITSSFYSSGNLKISGKNISIYSDAIDSLLQVEAEKSLEIEGDRIDLQEGIRLKSGNGSLKIIGKKIVGAGRLESGGAIYVLSSSDLCFNSVYSLGDISLVAKGGLSFVEMSTDQKGDIKLSGNKLDVGYINGAQKLIIYGSKITDNFKLSNVDNIELVEENSNKGKTNSQDFNIVSPLDISGDFKFVGRNFKNQSVFKAKNIILELSGDFVNDVAGSITASDSINLVSSSVTNRHKIYVENSLGVKADHLINDNGGDISASSIRGYLMGKMDDGYAFSQRSNSILESRNGGIELIAPIGGIYFGYKRELTGEGDNKDGFKFIGSKLVSHGGDIHIQSGGDVIFEGMQSLGKVIVEAQGKVRTLDPNDSYRSGTERVAKIGRCGCTTYVNEPRLQQVTLKTSFAEKEFFSEKENIIFNTPTADTQFENLLTSFSKTIIKRQTGFSRKSINQDNERATVTEKDIVRLTL